MRTKSKVSAKQQAARELLAAELPPVSDKIMLREFLRLKGLTRDDLATSDVDDLQRLQAYFQAVERIFHV
jgi:hypothetical protein